MSSKIALPIIVVCLMGAIALTVRGCNSGEGNHWATGPMSQAEVERQIRGIQANPHMPERAKSIAIGQIRAHAGGATVHPASSGGARSPQPPK